MNDHTHELSESLNRQASGVDVGTVPSLAGVRGRAGQLRRKRRAITAGVALAALAVATPVAWSLGRNSQADPLPPAQSPTVITDGATATPSTPSSPAVNNGQEGTMDLRHLPTSTDVGVGWVDMSGTAFVLHRADGTTTEVAVPGNERVFSFATLTDGRTVAKTESKVLVWDKNGVVTFQEDSPGYQVAVDPQHRTSRGPTPRGNPGC